MTNQETFIHDLKQMPLTLSSLQIEQFTLYHDLLIVANEKTNLTAITEEDDIYKKHFLDSLALIYWGCVENDTPLSLADIGSGAGFPGIPLKIACPWLDVTLIEARMKRVHFLHNVIEQLGLANIRVVHGRAEELSRLSEYRERFDLCVSRAVAPLTVLVEYCLPYVKQGGLFVAYKTPNEDERTAADTIIPVLGGEYERTLHFVLPGTQIERTLIGINKVSSTPAKYPRREAAIRKTLTKSSAHSHKE
ncbi:MAG: 16S rRNA (guanine(527)-N(7))-methyltransferase RsmG [Lachnospiraceae bacterium]|jgi:16S rRNA (guanine527-N7)-methyltransferase|nr:16S rRNA (guanine(527)-N(7))-methyltransferase RsmG [Lachnospiraceae bacterium]